jgi:hypothetical protein
MNSFGIRRSGLYSAESRCGQAWIERTNQESSRSTANRRRKFHTSSPNRRASRLKDWALSAILDELLDFFHGGAADEHHHHSFDLLNFYVPTINLNNANRHIQVWKHFSVGDE